MKRSSTHDRQLPEILVQGHEHATLRVGSCQDFFVTWILIPLTCPNDVVPGFHEI